METNCRCFNRGIGDYLFCLIGHCNTIKIPLVCLVCYLGIKMSVLFIFAGCLKFSTDEKKNCLNAEKIEQPECWKIEHS
jgi:hypothetical protein